MINDFLDAFILGLGDIVQYTAYISILGQKDSFGDSYSSINGKIIRSPFCYQGFDFCGAFTDI